MNYLEMNKSYYYEYKTSVCKMQNDAFISRCDAVRAVIGLVLKTMTGFLGEGLRKNFGCRVN